MIPILENFIHLSRKLNVLIVGETIVDEFVPVLYEGQSMKSFCPVFRLTDGEKQIQQGGTAAIANHLRDFVGNIKVITNSNNEITKTRYVDVNNGQKHIEINKFDTKGFAPISVKTEDYDLVIVADFGHGFCDKLDINDGFCLMTQTNSNNFGFNRVSKWKGKRKKSVCIDLREASLQMNQKIKNPDYNNIKSLYDYELDAENLFVTTGKEGALFFDGSQYIEQKTFQTQVVDTIGAGDAFFGFSCLLATLKNDLNLDKSLFIPALAASLTTTWLCNEKNVTPTSLKEHASRYL